MDKVNEFADELNDTLNNIKGKISSLTSFVTSMQKVLIGGEIKLIFLVKPLKISQDYMVYIRL